MGTQRALTAPHMRRNETARLAIVPVQQRAMPRHQDEVCGAAPSGLTPPARSCTTRVAARSHASSDERRRATRTVYRLQTACRLDFYFELHGCAHGCDSVAGRLWMARQQHRDIRCDELDEPPLHVEAVAWPSAGGLRTRNRESTSSTGGPGLETGAFCARASAMENILAEESTVWCAVTKSFCAFDF